MNRDATFLAALVPVAYLIGSIPFGLLVGRAKGIDPRQGGSGNIGATNVGRLLGAKFFALVFTLDLLKGAAPVLAAGAAFRFRPAGAGESMAWMLIGFAAVAGHLFSLFLRFKGGKGVATSTGVALGVFPYFTLATIIAVAVFLVALRIWRAVSIGSILGSIAFPLGYLITGLAIGWPIFSDQLPLLTFSILVPVMIIYKHRGNIARLRGGTEHRL